jgi:HupE / UreJ protein
MKRALMFLASIFLCSSLALAHKASDSYFNINLKNPNLTGRWDVALRDLDYAIGLDDNDDGVITWRELKTHRVAVQSYLLSKLELRSENQTCKLTSSGYLVDNHTDGAYVVLPFSSNCSSNPSALKINYNLFFDLDPQHRGLLNLETVGGTQTAIFSPENHNLSFQLREQSPISQFLEFVRAGVLHIWGGIDHILFLLALLLPSVLRRENGRWMPVGNFKTALSSVLKIVTAFTLAHSITLSLAALEVVNLPSRLIESTIAASVVLAALNNVFPVVQERRRWLVAFGFGLIHGFGFASVLSDLELTRVTLLRSLVGFNVGVELGQLSIVMVFLPLAFSLRSSSFYNRFTLAIGSLAVAAIAGIWMAERIFDFKVLPI